MRQRDLYPDCPIGLPGEGGSGHLLIEIYLVDSATGIVQAHSAVTWPPRFVAWMRAGIAHQVAGAQDDGLAGTELDGLYARYPANGDLARHADIACKGGR